MTPGKGTLYGIGVGPGDPELITLKALKILKRTPYIFAATSSKNTYSLALDIVRSHVQEAKVEKLPFPMTREPAVLQEAWADNARRVLEVLANGSDAAFITLGDPLTFSTFGYLLKTIKQLDSSVRVVTIPGITSYHAAAALIQAPVSEGEESFLVVSGAMGAAKLRESLELTDNIILLKTYRHLDDILATLKEMGLADKAVCISRCGLEDETVVHDVRRLTGQSVPYLSMLIIKKKEKFW